MARRTTAFYSARLPNADDLLRFCHAMHEHAHRREARNGFVALATFPNRLHDRYGVGNVFYRIPNRPRTRILSSNVLQLANSDGYRGGANCPRGALARCVLKEEKNRLRWRLWLPHGRLQGEVETLVARW